jgi:hypothetical protein
MNKQLDTAASTKIFLTTLASSETISCSDEKI